MNSLLNTKTADNVAKAFAGESQARNRYTYYSKVADKEGLKQISAIFLETADNERSHAKIFFNFLNNGLKDVHIKVNAEYPIGFGNTQQNLQYAANGEKEEWGTLYPQFMEAAKQEGFPEVEAAFKNIIEIETHHEQRFLDYLNQINSGELFKKSTTVLWKCRNCGYIYEGTEAPKVCPACKHPQGYFEVV